MDIKKQSVLLPPSGSLRDGLDALNRAALGIVIVVDERRRLLGTVTDGDVRRAILRGVGLDEPLSSVMKLSPTSVKPGTDTQELRRVFVEQNLKQLPVVDEAGTVVDLITVNDLLRIPLSSPDIADPEIQAVLAVLRSRDLSLGPAVVRFEKSIAEYTQRRHAIAVNSGTSGLHLVVRALGLGLGDEVITTPFSFIASSNCLLYEGVTPVFVDIDPATYNLDPDRVEAAITPRTKAVLVVDVFGQPADYDSLNALVAKHGLQLIVDSCESIGAEYLGRRASTEGVAAVFGFYPNKQITTGEGGAIVTDDDQVARLCRSMRNQGRAEGGGWLAHERLGYNYRLPDINCALGQVQVERLDGILASRQGVADIYNRLLAQVPGIHLPYVHASVTRMSWFVYVIRLAERFTRADRDAICDRLRSEGVGVNNYFQPIHLQPFYRERFGFKVGDFPITEAVGDRTIALPFFNQLNEPDIIRVVDVLRRALAEVVRP